MVPEIQNKNQNAQHLTAVLQKRGFRTSMTVKC
jgi:hypothetical protein